MPDVSSRELEYSLLDDEELTQRLHYRDLQAFETLYNRYGNLVYSTTMRVVRDEQIAQDLGQEIFLRLWRKPESYTAHRGKFSTWLASVARNRAVDEVRSRQRRSKHETPSPDNQERVFPSPAEDDPAVTAELAGQRRMILEALAALPPDQREVIELAYFGGLTQQEIAERLSQPLGTVKTRVRLGMQKLRAVLAPRLRGEDE